MCTTTFRWQAVIAAGLKLRFIYPHRNIVVFVGDGMGIQTVTMSRIYKGQTRAREAAGDGVDKSGEGEELVWESFPNTGFSKASREYPSSVPLSVFTLFLSFRRTM